jgi:hypothetical protein
VEKLKENDLALKLLCPIKIVLDSALLEKVKKIRPLKRFLGWGTAPSIGLFLLAK